MQTLTTMDKVVVDECYHMTTMDEVNWIKITHLLPICSLNLRTPPFVHLSLLQILVAFLDAQTKEK
jgi:hypothetical protein